MKFFITSALFCVSLFLCSCIDQNPKIVGIWEATFNDPIKNPIQYLDFKNVQNKLTLSVDEPAEDWYNIQGEKLSFQNDSLHYERFWGLEKYDAVFQQGDSIMSGIKQIQNKPPIPFSIRKISQDKLVYKIPVTDSDKQPLKKYVYNKPAQNTDGFNCGTLEEVGINPDPIYSLITKILTKEVPNIHSLLILKDNKLVLEEYFYSYTAYKPHRIHSVTKSITSALTGIAIDKNLITDINKPVWEYFTDWDKAKWVSQKYDIGLKHLLSMSAGLEWKGLTPNESNDDIDMYKTGDYFGFLLNKNQKFTPGTNFTYNNGLSIMLGHIIEKVSALSIDSFSRKFLFNDLAISNYSWDIDDNGITRMDGGLKMRPVDMLKFGQLYLNEGTWNGKQLISKNWIVNSTSEKLGLSDRGYAYHWWTKDYSVNGTLFRTYYALGHGEQAIIIIPEVKLVFVMTAGNYMQVEKRPFEIMAQYILPSLKSVDKSPQVRLSDFAGEYQINQTESIIIGLRDSVLHAVDPAGMSYILKRKSDYGFITEDQSREVQFLTDNNGKIAFAEVYVKGQKAETLKKIK